MIGDSKPGKIIIQHTGPAPASRTWRYGDYLAGAYLQSEKDENNIKTYWTLNM